MMQQAYGQRCQITRVDRNTIAVHAKAKPRDVQAMLEPNATTTMKMLRHLLTGDETRQKHQ